MKIKFVITLFLAILSITLLSCNTKEHKQNRENQIYCYNNLNYLFSVPDSTPQFKINYSSSKDSIFDFIESHFDNDSCWHKKELGLILDTNVSVKINYSKRCSLDYYLACSGDYRSNTVFRVSLNSHGELYMEGKVSQTNQIAHTIFNKFSNQNYPFVFSIIKWKGDTPVNTIKLVIKKIVHGYGKCYEKLANEFFNKSLHQLTIKELDKLTSILPFDLRLLEVERNKFIRPPIIIQEIIN